ncbi:cobaltochelatase [Calothrix sp. NIES-4071]|nr:cobaltochelatase [Calothrix sp. NIES-4071]BAZ61994.1 cobaltochelatase [Calothrix sp. NIES-4105]
MHRINTTSVGVVSQSEGIIFVEQNPAPVVFLTAADTDIQSIAAAYGKLPFPALRVANLLQLQHQISIDTYAEQVLEYASVIILRLLGGRSYWTYGLEVVQELVQRNHIDLIVMPGDDGIDPYLISHSTLGEAKVNRIWRYFNEGGVSNIVHAFQYISDCCLSTTFSPPQPQLVPRVGVYGVTDKEEYSRPRVGILFYRAHYLVGNTKVIDALCEALIKQNLEPLPVFVSSLREKDVQAELEAIFQPPPLDSRPPISLLLNTTSFSLARLETETPQIELWQKLDVPVLQVIFSGGFIEQWESDLMGLSPRDMAMNVALPEVDGRIISRAVSFKAVQNYHPELETNVVGYEPIASRIDFVAELAANWVRLRNKPSSQRRLAFILANYPTRDGRLANGVGLDTPASCVEILKGLQNSGYELEKIPQNGDELIQWLTSSVTNDPEGRELRSIYQSLSQEEYQAYFTSLPETVQQAISQRWGDTQAQIPISGIQLGNIFIGIQPSRGYDLDPSLNYHAPDLEPTHNYLAFYHWVRQHFKADAIVHVGKHGNLEWLPGKSIALSNNCFPEVALGAMPHLYPFIVNDPGEGSQAKRRAQAVIVDHLTPPLTRAELYGSLQNLENLIDEYYEAHSLNPSRLPAITVRISELVTQQNLHLDLRMRKGDDKGDEVSINKIDGYLCELKEAQIRDGLHIFGQCPDGRQLRDLIIAIARQPCRHHIGITCAIATDWGLEINPLTDDFSQKLTSKQIELLAQKTNYKTHTIGDAVEALEERAAHLVEQIIQNSLNIDIDARGTDAINIRTDAINIRTDAINIRTDAINIRTDAINRVSTWIQSRLLPALLQTDREIINLLRGLDGKYVPSGASGAPTRGRPEVLPTGNNFYSVDIRAVPTESAWDVGSKAAETVIECYTQEHGEYPKTLVLSLWGTATMRTGGDDIAQALALLGVQPVWDSAARRVVDLEILPLSVLGRPRVDVTLRVSGFFRDAFGNLINLFDQAVEAVAALDEPPGANPLAAQVLEEMEYWQKVGLSETEAKERSLYRIFGSKPGAYGAGLQGLIESQNWSDDSDLARAYINWSSYAYTRKSDGRSAPEAFSQRLLLTQVVLHNQDNREHDLLDSDDYYQFQGGLTAAVRSIRGENPETYFGDNSIPAKPRVRQLSEEIARVYRSRVINPKWIASVMRHGYKGAFEMAATVDFLFAYDATAKCVEDHMYEGIAKTYLFDSRVCKFIEEKNPYALRDIAERLLEAYKRGLWEDVNIQTLENLRNLVHQAEAAIEQPVVSGLSEP